MCCFKLLIYLKYVGLYLKFVGLYLKFVGLYLKFKDFEWVIDDVIHSSITQSKYLNLKTKKHVT